MIELLFGITAGIVLTKKLKVLEKIKLPSIPKLPKFKVIVKINDDKYAIRKGYFGLYEYFHFQTGIWISKDNRFFGECLGSKEQALSHFAPDIKSETVVDL